MSAANEPANRIEELALSALFTVISVGLLAAIGWATRSGPATSGWWTAPALAPGAALMLLSLANVQTVWSKLRALRNSPPNATEWAQFHHRLRMVARPLEFLAYFAVYLFALRHIGYGPATLIFILGLMLRVGLTSPKWLLTGVLTCAGLILIFRIGLGVWMPAPELYDLFPGALRSVLIRWF